MIRLISIYRLLGAAIGVLMVFVANAQVTLPPDMLLNGQWQTGINRHYDHSATVPGITGDPTKIASGKRWYKKEITLPGGNWEQAILELKGARFLPEVYVNGKLISKSNGGMAPTFHPLVGPDVRPGNKVLIEVALASLKDVPITDASYIPPPDQWRSNVSSCLWDDVVIHFAGNARIIDALPDVDFNRHHVSFKFNIAANAALEEQNVVIKITDKNHRVVLTKREAVNAGKNSVDLDYRGKLIAWSPQQPNLYQVQIDLQDKQGKLADRVYLPLGIKKITVRDKQFYLNNQPCKVGGGTVVWHRWVRTDEGRVLGYDIAWFYKNVVKRLKEHGANYLRFHLGVPPERLLDMCDKYGLLVQYEWNFFHGMPASQSSLLEQYKAWLDAGLRHPCVSFIHPYNETEGDQLKTVNAALDKLLPNYPPVLLEDRDEIHVHKYWWSLFENLGLYYDSYRQFPKAVMVDEFGGNYLDANGDPGNYVTVKESLLRFLGRNHTKAMRLKFQALSNGKVAEYWRRVGVAGIAPFCILGSTDDGNNWFMGKLSDGNPKPVWDALTAVWSPRSVSLELWDRNFTPGQQLALPVYYFNDTPTAGILKVKLTVTDSTGKLHLTKLVNASLNAFSRKVQNISMLLPAVTGTYTIRAELLNRPATVKYPVVSAWDIHVFKPVLPGNLNHIAVGIPAGEMELKAFVINNHMHPVAMDDPQARVILTSLNTWEKIAAQDKGTINDLQNAIKSGRSVVMLDIGDRHLGQGYPDKEGELGPLQGVATVADPKSTAYPLFGGITLTFKEVAEPESHIHPDKENNSLWQHIPYNYTWLWNGLRGGLIVPASDMEFAGLNPASFLAQWKTRGANEELIKGGHYYAYELQGFYSFSEQQDDAATIKKLKDRVAFLVQDAPALAISINPNTAVRFTDLALGYKQARGAMAESLTPLANAGKNLTRTPVVMIGFGQGRGRLIASQLLTAGRLTHGNTAMELYAIRYDEVAVQYVLNMMSLSLNNNQK